MDIDKTIQFMLESQAKHDSAMAEMDSRLNRLSEAVVALADQQKEFNLSLMAVRDVMLRHIVETTTLFKETDRRFAETDRRFAETDRRIGELVSAVGEYIRKSASNKPNAQQ